MWSDTRSVQRRFSCLLLVILLTSRRFRSLALRFPDGLDEGRRYYLCIRAGPTTYIDVHGATEVVEHDLEMCSDGITIDTTPPTYVHVLHWLVSDSRCFCVRTGAVTIGNQLGAGAAIHSFVTSTQQLHVTWTGFADLESLATAVSVHRVVWHLCLILLSSLLPIPMA
jgi:hypothetical protein